MYDNNEKEKKRSGKNKHTYNIYTYNIYNILKFDFYDLRKYNINGYSRKKSLYSIQFFQQSKWDCKQCASFYVLLRKIVLNKNIPIYDLLYDLFLYLRTLVTLSQKLLRSMNNLFEIPIFKSFAKSPEKG